MSLRELRSVLTTLIAACMCTGLGAAEPSVVLKVSAPTAGDASEDWMKAFKAGVETRTGGAVRVELYPNGQLGQIPATVEGVAMGTIEVSIAAVAFFSRLEPRFQALDIPGTMVSIEHAQRTFDDPELRRRIATFGETKGIEPLFVFAAGPTALLLRQPVKSLATLKGQKIRLPGPGRQHSEPLSKLGAFPLAMSLGEAMPAMHNRTIDGLMAGLPVFTVYRYYDVSRHLTEMPGSYLISAGVVNRAFMKSLSLRYQTIVREEAANAAALLGARVAHDIGVAQRKWFDNGGTYHRLSADDQAHYLSEVGAVLQVMLAEDAVLRADHDALRSTARRLLRR